MSRKNKLRARPRSLGKKLTPKQSAFLHHYTNPTSDGFGNGAKASELAGYKGEPGSNQLAVQGSRNVRHPDLREAIKTELGKQGFTPQFAAKLLMGAMRATVVRALPNRKGKLVLCRFSDHRTRLQAFDRASRLAGVSEDKQGYGADAEFGCEYLSKSEKEVANPYADWSSTDLILARSFTEKVIKIAQLGGGTPAEVVARIVARTKESTGIGSTHGPSQVGSGDRPAFGFLGEGP